MKSEDLITTVHATTRTSASRAAVYDTLADLSTHLVWGGAETGDKRFRLLTMERPDGAAVSGTRFASTGLVQMGTFHDESVITDATGAARFSFHTESVLERPRGDAWRGWFEHRYTLDTDGDQTIIRYECELYAGNYVPYWWKLPMRPVTKLMVQRIMTTSLRSLARTAETAKPTMSGATTVRDAAAAS